MKSAIRLERSWFAECRKFQDIGNSLDVLNVGSSNAVNGLNYDAWNLRGMNLAMSPQSQSYSFQILRQFGCRLKKNGTALIPVSPFDCCLESYPQEFRSYRYYSFLNPELISGYSESTHEEIRRFLAKHPFPEITANAEKPNLTGQEKIVHAEFITRTWWMEPFGITDLSRPLPGELQKRFHRVASILKEMLAFCRANSIRPVLILFPVSRGLMAWFTPDFRHHYIESFLAEFRDSAELLIDAFGSPRWESSDFFADSFYLNSSGRREFTGWVLKQCQLI